MTRSLSLPCRLLGLALLVLVAPRGAGAQDPLAVNPNTLRLKLENDRVRVLEATLPPGAKEQLHSHPAYVIHVLSDGKVRTHFPDGRSVDADVHAGDVIFREPVTHWAENIGSTEVRFLLVELKAPAADPAATKPVN